MAKKIGGISFTKANLSFDNDFEKEIHSKLSKIRFGETIEIKIESADKEEILKYKTAIYKSGFYNNIDLHLVWSKDYDLVKVTALY